MEEEKLPKEILDKASISKGGEYAWKREDIPKVLQAAKKIGLACLGGQPQFQGPIGTAEPYWINYEPKPRMENESWEDYSKRSLDETLVAFNRVCAETDFLKEAMTWEHIKNAVEKEGINPLDHLWFVLYFEEEKR